MRSQRSEVQSSRFSGSADRTVKSSASESSAALASPKALSVGMKSVTGSSRTLSAAATVPSSWAPCSACRRRAAAFECGAAAHRTLRIQIQTRRRRSDRSHTHKPHLRNKSNHARDTRKAGSRGAHRDAAKELRKVGAHDLSDDLNRRLAVAVLQATARGVRRSGCVAWLWVGTRAPVHTAGRVPGGNACATPWPACTACGGARSDRRDAKESRNVARGRSAEHGRKRPLPFAAPRLRQLRRSDTQARASLLA